MLATPQNLHLARAMARLDALTDWERRPRSAMRVGLEPMLDLAARLGYPQKAFRSIDVANMSFRPVSESCRSHRLQWTGLNPRLML
jgi:hypothetical protein